MKSPPTHDVYSCFTRYYDDLLRFVLRRIGCKEDAADVVQDSFLKVLKRKDLGKVREPRAYLYRTVSNLTVDFIRRKYTRTKLLNDDEKAAQEPSGENNPYQTICAKERLKVLEHAVHSMTPKCRKVFVMHRFAGMSHKQIATELNISRSTVEKHMIRALGHCRDQIADYYREPLR